MADREAIIEARMLLLLRANRGEFGQAPVGEFEARWNAIDPSTPAPVIRHIQDITCECDICQNLLATTHERPVLAKVF